MLTCVYSHALFLLSLLENLDGFH
uniref:Uncharacterized protein n=1 Tax=Rhizophora mucronata TaxID=61149 RepID=A0A2P2QWJ6_RHIMU